MNSPDTQIVATQNDLATTQSLVARLVREYVRPHRGRLGLAVLCMAVVAGTTAANAYLMKPVFDDVFILKDKSMLFIIPITILLIAVIKGAATYGQSVLMSLYRPKNRRNYSTRHVFTPHVGRHCLFPEDRHRQADFTV